MEPPTLVWRLSPLSFPRAQAVHGEDREIDRHRISNAQDDDLAGVARAVFIGAGREEGGGQVRSRPVRRLPNVHDDLIAIDVTRQDPAGRRAQVGALEWAAVVTAELACACPVMILRAASAVAASTLCVVKKDKCRFEIAKSRR